MVLPKGPAGAGALLAALSAASALTLPGGGTQGAPSLQAGGAPADAKVSLGARSRRMATAREMMQMQEAIDEAAERQAAQAARQKASLATAQQDQNDTRPHILKFGRTQPGPCPEGEDCLVRSMTNQRGNMNRPLIIQLNRGRLGHHMFQWAAALSIAKELKARQFRLVIREDAYAWSNTTVMDRLRTVAWSPADFEFLQISKEKCHVWDKMPFFIDDNLTRFNEFTLWGSQKGVDHIPGDYDEPDDGNLAAAAAQAITKTKTPKRCHVWELDGYFLNQGFFRHHIAMIRLAFWDEPTAVKAEDTLRWLLWNEEPSGSAVGIHIRFGDSNFTGRNLPLQYYTDAIQRVHDKVAGPLTCVIFTDRLDEAMKASKYLNRCKTRIPMTPGLDDQTTFYMMSLLPNLIIADSVFSFWAARLSPNKPLVVAPLIRMQQTRLQQDYEYLAATPGWVMVDTEVGPVGDVAKGVFIQQTTFDENAPSGFLKLGRGYCNNGYYAGHDKADAVDLRTCAQRCQGEDKCMFFSLQVGKSCSRFTTYAGECERSSKKGMETHVTFARISKDNEATRKVASLKMAARKSVDQEALAGHSSVDEMTLEEVSRLGGYVAPSSEWAY